MEDLTKPVLKECPFCASAPMVEEDGVYCDNPLCPIQLCGFNVEQWQTRATPRIDIPYEPTRAMKSRGTAILFDEQKAVEVWKAMYQSRPLAARIDDQVEITELKHKQYKVVRGMLSDDKEFYGGYRERKGWNAAIDYITAHYNLTRRGE